MYGQQAGQGGTKFGVKHRWVLPSCQQPPTAVAGEGCSRGHHEGTAPRRAGGSAGAGSIRGSSSSARAQQELLPLLPREMQRQRRERCRGVIQGWEGRLQPVGLGREPCLQRAPGNSPRKQVINPGPACTVILLAAFPQRLRHGPAATELRVPGCGGDAPLRAGIPRLAAWHGCCVLATRCLTLRAAAVAGRASSTPRGQLLGAQALGTPSPAEAPAQVMELSWTGGGSRWLSQLPALIALHHAGMEVAPCSEAT